MTNPAVVLPQPKPTTSINSACLGVPHTCKVKIGSICKYDLLLLWTKLFYLGLIDEPKFSYVDLYLVKITYTKGANRTLYVCCQTLFPDDMWLSWASCGEISMCPSYETPSHCVTSGRQVCCEADRIQENVTLSGYLGWLDGEERIRLSETATYITSKSGRSQCTGHI